MLSHTRAVWSCEAVMTRVVSPMKRTATTLSAARSDAHTKRCGATPTAKARAVVLKRVEVVGQAPR